MHSVNDQYFFCIEQAMHIPWLYCYSQNISFIHRLENVQYVTSQDTEENAKVRNIIGTTIITLYLNCLYIFRDALSIWRRSKRATRDSIHSKVATLEIILS